MAKEKCAKESQRHGDSGKKASIAHFGGGARYVARSMIGQIPPAIRRAPNSPVSAVKMGGPFSLRCLSPPSPPRSAWGIRKPCRLGYFGVAWLIQQGHRQAGFGNNVGLWREPRGPSPSGGISAAKLLSLEYPRALWATRLASSSRRPAPRTARLWRAGLLQGKRRNCEVTAARQRASRLAGLVWLLAS